MKTIALKILSFPGGKTRLETLRLQFLNALYEKDGKSVFEIYSRIAEFAKNGGIPENDEKRLTQVQCSYKRLADRLDSSMRKKSLEIYQKLKTRLTGYARTADPGSDIIGFSAWKKQVNVDSQIFDIICKTAMTFQLTTGCSNFCRRCNEWALPKIRRGFSFEAVSAILSGMAQQKNPHISLYGASDPLDWQEGSRSIQDIVETVQSLDLEYSLLTKIPKGKGQLLCSLCKASANLSVSVTTKNKHRVAALEQQLSILLAKQHDSDDLLIPAGLDEDFSSVKPSITDGYGTEITPDGVFIIIPAFTSALNPFGHEKIQVVRETDFFPLKRTGRQALLVDYFKPLKGLDKRQKPVCLDHLLPVQIETILLDSGAEDLTPPGMTSMMEFLSIFDEPARIRRSKMTPAVMKNLKKKELKSGSFQALSRPDKKSYKKHIQAHIDLCSRKKCLELKLAAVSFFLDEIERYCSDHPVERAIIQYLLRFEIADLKKWDYTLPASLNIELLFSEQKSDHFKMFRYLALDLTRKAPRHIKPIRAFIKNTPSKFDPISDLFSIQ